MIRSRAQRAAVYALGGWCAEIAFTALQRSLDPEQRDWRLMGHTYLWMLPIYASLAVLYEPIRDRLRGTPVWKRACVYAAGFVGVEYASGMAIKATTGLVPWDYTGRGRLVIHGATRLDWLPLWAAAGLALEPVTDRIRGVGG